LTLSLVVYVQILSAKQLQLLIELKCTRSQGFLPLFPDWVGATMPRCVRFVCDAAHIYLTKRILLCDESPVFKIMTLLNPDEQCTRRHDTG